MRVIEDIKLIEDDTFVFEQFKPSSGVDFVTDLHVYEETEATLTSDQGDGTAAVDASILQATTDGSEHNVDNLGSWSLTAMPFD